MNTYVVCNPTTTANTTTTISFSSEASFFFHSWNCYCEIENKLLGTKGVLTYDHAMGQFVGKNIVQ
jgi:hypothetical protein